MRTDRVVVYLFFFMGAAAIFLYTVIGDTAWIFAELITRIGTA
jgi:hypothetical protein